MFEYTQQHFSREYQNLLASTCQLFSTENTKFTFAHVAPDRTGLEFNSGAPAIPVFCNVSPRPLQPVEPETHYVLGIGLFQRKKLLGLYTEHRWVSTISLSKDGYISHFGAFKAATLADLFTQAEMYFQLGDDALIRQYTSRFWKLLFDDGKGYSFLEEA